MNRKGIFSVAGVLLGVLLGVVAVQATQAVVVTASSTNPACDIPLVNLACSFGLAPSEISNTVTVTGLGAIVIMTLLTFLVILALAGFFLLFLLRREEGAALLAYTLAGFVLGFVTAFALGYGIFIALAATAICAFIEGGLYGGFCDAWQIIVTYGGALFLIAGIAGAFATYYFLRHAAFGRGEA